MDYYIKCPVCGCNNSIACGYLPFELHDGNIMTAIYKCSKCHSFWRALPDKLDISSHFDLACYTANEQRDIWTDKRHQLFMQVNRLLKKHRPCSSQTLLDVGCAYGHMIEFFAQKGVFCTAVEPVTRLRKDISRSGITVYAGLEMVPHNIPYHAITFIDSLYYIPRPLEALTRAVMLLSPDGLVIIRMANRTPFLRLLYPFGITHVFQHVFSDQLVALSHCGILNMVHAAGARVQATYFYEARCVEGIGDFALYRVLGLFAAITRIPVSPGILYVISRR